MWAAEYLQPDIHSGRQDEFSSTQTQVLENQSKLTMILEEVVASHKKLELLAETGPIKIRKVIVALLERQSSNIHGEYDKDGYPAWHDLPAQLMVLASSSIEYAKELKIVESLRYPEITTREERIVDAHSGTFDWVFAEPDKKSDSRSKASLLQ